MQPDYHGTIFSRRMRNNGLSFFSFRRNSATPSVTKHPMVEPYVIGRDGNVLGGAREAGLARPKAGWAGQFRGPESNCHM